MLLGVDDFGRYGATESLMLDGLYAQVDSGANAWNLDTANPRTGTRALRLGPNPNGYKLIRRIFGSAKDSAGVGAAFYMTELPVTEGINGGVFVNPMSIVLFDFRDTANASQFIIICGTDGSIQAYLNTDIIGGSGGMTIGTDLGRSNPCVAAGSWNLIQCFAHAHASSGEIEVRVNGATVLSISGVPTVATANIEYSQVVIGTGGTSTPVFANSGSALDLADFHFWDDTGSYNNDFLGDNKAFLSMPNGDSGPSDWTRSAGGSNYALIDEVPPNDAADYLTTDTPGDQVQVDTSNLPVQAQAVAGVVAWFRGRKTDAGDCKVKIGVVSNGVTAWGDEHILTTGYRYFESIFETDPDTSLPWTSAAVDAAKVIYERTV